MVGGMGYPCVVVQKHDSEGFTTEDIYLHDSAQMTATLKSLLSGDKGPLPASSPRTKRSIKLAMTAYADWLDAGPVDLTPLAVEHKMITGILTQYQLLRTTTYTFIPGLLNAYGMSSVLVPHEAHMLVSRFVGGILSTSKPVLELTDTSKIQKAGFDLKTSFRKPSEKHLK